MRVVKMTPTYLFCQRSWLPVRVIGAVMIFSSLNLLVFGFHEVSIWLIAAVFLVGFGLLRSKEEQSVVIDRVAGTARITNRSMGDGLQVLDVPLSDILDAAVERAPANTRAVFICRDGRIVPWEPWSRLTTWSGTDAAKTVAAARIVGGWHALPTQKYRSQHVPFFRIPWAQFDAEMRAR